MITKMLRISSSNSNKNNSSRDHKVSKKMLRQNSHDSTSSNSSTSSSSGSLMRVNWVETEEKLLILEKLRLVKSLGKAGTGVLTFRSEPEKVLDCALELGMELSLFDFEEVGESDWDLLWIADAALLDVFKWSEKCNGTRSNCKKYQKYMQLFRDEKRRLRQEAEERARSHSRSRARAHPVKP